MSYATVADLIAEFGEAELVELTDRADPPNGAVDETVAQRALDRVDAEIDGRVSVLYSTPLSPVPEIIRTIALDLARAALYVNAMPETVATREKNARKLLEAINAGTLKIGITVPAAATVATVVQVDSPDRVFSRANRGL